MRDVDLTVIDGGIQRLRTRGGANPKSLYDLKNGYVTADKKVKRRPGTFRHAKLPEGTKGLCGFAGELHVFSHEAAVVPEGYRLHILAHPVSEDDDGDPIPLKRIHFAEPFMNALYVVAEFDVAVGGDIAANVYHFWLQGEGADYAWQANAEYRAGELVHPTVPTGLFYRATRLGTPNPAWTPTTPRKLGDLVEPTEYNDFYYEAVLVTGDDPRSGNVEPLWPTVTGQQVSEDVAGPEESGSPQPPPVVVAPQEGDRYRIVNISRPGFR